MKPLLMPAEWEPHRATWIAWPHCESDFPEKLGVIQWVYSEIVRVLAESEWVEILVHPEQMASVQEILQKNHVPLERVRLHSLITDRSWLRDSFPTCVRQGGSLAWVGWRFNAWAKYDNFQQDQQLPRFAATTTRLPLIEATRPDSAHSLTLEGGGIDVDGAGLVLVTEEWLLSQEQVRNPGLLRQHYEEIFQRYLGATQTIWLGSGCVGDDTHGHVDDIARFVAPNTVVLACEENPADENYESSQDNLRRLLNARNARGEPLTVIKLPFPRPLFFHGERLPASYANFYIANSVVMVPTFNDERDREALAIFSRLFPTRRIVGIHAVDLVLGRGTLHCLTQQEYQASANS